MNVPILSGCGQRRALGHKKVGTKYVTEEGTSGFSRWRIGIAYFRFRNMTLRYHISSRDGSNTSRILGERREGATLSRGASEPFAEEEEGIPEAKGAANYAPPRLLHIQLFFLL